MTDASCPVKPVNGHDLSHHQAFLHATAAHQQRYHAPIVNGDAEDDGQISCICGFADDDGWTVACDKCNRWQHQSCYYPQYDERQLPEHLQHYCVDCEPRHVDIAGARRRQLVKREPSEQLMNGSVKRTASKSHKKKVKEPVPAHTNGWPVDKLRNDRTSASPRDQPPPAKRPKTSHRTSDSTTTTSTKGHSRKRNASTANHRRSLSRSPDSPIERYSENFLQSYTPDDWSVTDNNLHDSLSVTHSLSDWVDMHEDDFEEVHGQVKGEALMRYDGDLDNMPGKALLEIVSQYDEGVTYRGQPASWKMVTVQDPLPNGSYIGEIKGRICFKKDYQEEAANRWAEMRHPEPFVFFHSRMPIALDARSEGTDLRYVRRSCYPNARLQILITGVADYHFCLLATEDIRPGEEIAIGWETTEGMPHLMKNNLTHDDLEHLTTWVSTVLANCGPCACGRQTEEPEQNDACCMARFDRRLAPGDERPLKAAKVKKRKNGQQVSPMNTNAVNSRSGSEARKIEPEDDGTDSRSASGSAGRGSVSRDITPNTHYSVNGAGMPELSEREKKKMAKEEEMFRRQEEESTGKQGKKKRNSGGSSLNTPSVTSSKQLGFPVAAPPKPADASQQAGQSSAKAMLGRKMKTQKSITKAPSRVVKRPRPNYVEASTQCDLDEEEAARRAPTPSSRKPFKSLRQTLLERCARNNQAILSTAPSRRMSAPRSVELADAMDLDQSVASKSPSPPPDDRPQSSGSISEAAETQMEDTEMTDIPDGEPKEEPVLDTHTGVSSTPEGSEQAGKRSSPSEPSPAPPWPAQVPAGSDASGQSAKPAAMRVDMPPPAPLPTTVSSGGPHTNGLGSIAQSPASMTPGAIFPPSVAAAVAPSPAKKKLSLSDYTRRKARREDSEVGHRDSSPASVASGPVVPPLQPSSSSEAHAAEGTAIEEDIKMEEEPAVAVENVPQTVTAA